MSGFATACVLSYNRRQFVAEALKTMVEGADYPLEVIVHDDGSTDPHLRDYLRTLVDGGFISTLIENPPGHNQGQGVALNRMFAMAQGDPIIKLDQDLLFKPGWLKQCVDILEANKREVEEGTQDKRIGVLGLHRYFAPPVNYADMHIRDMGVGETMWEEHTDFVGSSLVVPREVWEAYGPFEQHSEAFAEDREFKFRVRDEGDLALALPKPVDLAENQGFGVGPSTVVVDHGKVATIHKHPHLAVKGDDQ